MNVFGRLKPGVPLEQAQADLSTVAHNLENSYPDAYPKDYGYSVAAAGLQDELTRKARLTFLVLLGAAGFVLLIACANVANLLLARLLKVERELAVRAALGASRARLMRQLLTESVLLSLAGGALGLLLAPATLSLLVKFAERFTTRATEVRIDGTVLLFTALVSIGTGLLFGLAPTLRLLKTDLNDLLKEGGRSAGGVLRGRWSSITKGNWTCAVGRGGGMATPFLDPGEEMASVGRLLPPASILPVIFMVLTLRQACRPPRAATFLSTMAVAERLESAAAREKARERKRATSTVFRR